MLARAGRKGGQRSRVRVRGQGSDLHSVKLGMYDASHPPKSKATFNNQQTPSDIFDRTALNMNHVLFRCGGVLQMNDVEVKIHTYQ